MSDTEVASTNEKTSFWDRRRAKILVIGIAGAVVSSAFFGLNWMLFTHDKVEKPVTVVGFSADPEIKNDGEFALGYPDHRYTVSCVSNGQKICILEVEKDKKDIVKIFPYVEQEWFTPGRKNRPYHSLDVVMSLPSYNGNGELKFGTDVAKNSALYDVLKQNEWVK